jgi:heme o synthase
VWVHGRSRDANRLTNTLACVLEQIAVGRHRATRIGGDFMSGTSAVRLVATPTWRSYLELTKPKIVALIVFTSIVGMLLARSGPPRWDALLWGTLGITLSSACAAVLNHVLDLQVDERMARTRMRPLPAGRVTQRQALAFAGVLGVTGSLVLLDRVNALTAVLSFAAVIGYGYIYTAWLKWATPQNIVIGGAAGAAPPVLGWAVVTDRLEANALILFLIILLWTPPHFWSLAIARRREYARTGVPMLPVTHGVPHTQSQIILYTILLSFATMLPTLVGMSGVIYLAGALALNSRFLYLVVKLKRSPIPNLPMRVFRYSITYLGLLFAVLLFDHYWNLPL